MRSFASLLALAAAVGCSDPPEIDYTVVTVSARPAVHDTAELVLTMVNEGTSRSEVIDFGNATYPATFSLSAEGRSGELEISLEALDGDGLLVGRGGTTITIGDPTASLMLDTTDFVVNTDFAADQYPSDSFETHGNQLAAGSDGTWTASYRQRCPDPCNVFARRFDARGVPVSTRVAAGTNGFPINTTLLDLGGGTPAAASAGAATLVVWDYSHETTPNTYVDGIACRSLDAQGNATPTELDISTDDNTDVVTIAPLSNSNFVVMWNALITNYVMRAAIVRPDCTRLAAPSTISLGTATTSRNAVAAHPTQSKILYAWAVDGGLHIAIANNTGALELTDTMFLAATATENVEAIRVAPLGDGFAIVVRWALSAIFEGPGRIEMYRVNNTGAVLGGGPILVTNRSGSDFPSSEAFGTATNAQGKLFVTWHSCEANGDGQGCGVFGRAFNPDGSVAMDEITIPTTTVGNQSNPSVVALPDGFAVAWMDESMQAPDTAGFAVRARIVYLP